MDPSPRPAAWNRRAALILARFSFASITLVIALAMITQATGPAWAAAALDLPFRLLCHRIPERVLSIAGVPMPLCSRCAGIWIGLSVSTTIARPALPLPVLRIVLVSAAALMLIEVITQDIGLHPVFHPTRLLTGLFLSIPFGGALGSLITRELDPRSGA